MNEWDERRIQEIDKAKNYDGVSARIGENKAEGCSEHTAMARHPQNPPDITQPSRISVGY